MKRFILIFCSIFILPAALTAQELEGTTYEIKHGIISLGGPGTGSSTYDLKNVIGTNVGQMDGSLYSMISGLLGLNSLPLATILSYNDSQPMEDETPTLSWLYSDADNDTQKRYQVQVARENFATVVVDSGIVSSAETSYTTSILPRTEERTSYKWRVRVYDGFDWSGWVQADNGFILTATGFLVTGLGALTTPGGVEIEQSTWQGDNDPYFYWDEPAGGIEVLGYSYSLDDLPDDEVDTRSTSYYFPEDSIGEGVHTFYVQAQRSSGLWGEAAAFAIWVDTTAPTIDNLQPASGRVIPGDQPEIGAVLQDAASGVDAQAIEMRLNLARVSPDYSPETGRVSFTPAIPLSEGELIVSLQGADAVGNLSTAVTWSFVIDTEAPEGSILINNGDKATTTNIVTLNISAEDDTSEVIEMLLSNDGIFDTEIWGPYMSLRKNWALPPITGVRKVYCKVKDEAGNVSEVFFDDINLTIIAPETYILSGPSGVTGSHDAEFTFRGSLDGCQFSYKFDNEDWSDWSGTDSVSRAGLNEDNHYFMVRAAKDLNRDGVFQLDEVDPTPALRVWIIGTFKPPAEPEKPIKIWEEE